MLTRQAPLIGFRRHLRATSVPEEETVYLVSARGTYALSGARIQVLAPLLDGSRDLTEIQRQVAADLSPNQLAELLGSLTQAQLVACRRPAGGDPDPAAEAYWDLADGAPPHPEPAAVHVVVLEQDGSALDPAAAGAALRAAGVAVSDAEGWDGVTLVLCDDYLDPRLAAVNTRQLTAGRPWLLAKPTGADLWVGPVFRPGEGPCWECLAARLREHRRGEALLRATGAAVSAPEASLPCTRALGLHLAALEVAKWLAGARDTGRDAIWTLDTLTLAARRHPLPTRPQCATCGDAGLTAARMRQPVTLSSRPKVSAGGNGHRAAAPEQVWQHYQHLVDPVTGVVDGIRRDPRSPDFLHSYLSGPNLATPGDRLGQLRAGLRHQSGGKGRTELEARVSALCEAVERYCGSRRGDEPVVRASLRELGHRAVHPDRCQLFHERQYRHRLRWNATTAGQQHVPEPFDETEVLDWTPAWSLTGRQHRYLPTDLLYFNRNGHRSVRATSNGNAAGASLEDAIVQGFLELVERDAVALWWYNRTRQPGVDLETFDDPWISDLRQRYAEIGRELWVLDVSSDLGIPAMAAVSRRVDKPAEDLMLGFGAHVDPAAALRRALTELGQLLPAVANARSDGTGYGAVDEHIRWWWLTATVSNQPYLWPDSDRAPRRRADYPYISRDDLREDAEQLVTLARAHGLEVLVVDQTRPDIGMPVVKVVVPGLRHFWARFAPGRLYEVPVRLGRLGAPTPYSELNPIPLFL